MLWFRYRWIPVFSRGLCIKIVRGGDEVKRLSSEIDALFRSPLSIPAGRNIIGKIMKLVNVLDYMVFSVGALLFREEKDLIKFSKRVEDAAEIWIDRVRRENAGYKKHADKVEKMVRELKAKKQNIPFRLEKGLQQEKAAVVEDDKRKKEVLALLQKIISFIKDADSKIYDIRLEAKAQKRGVANIYTLEEGITVRSMFRLGRVTKGRGIEVSSLIKKLRQKLKHFSRIVGTKKEINSSEVEQLLKYCKIELNDLRGLFLFVMQTTRKAEAKLNILGRAALNNPKMALLNNDIYAARRRIGVLRGDIEKQYIRLSNEFKRGNFAVAANVQQEMRAAA